MKELYISPAVKLISFVSSEKLAADWDFGITLANGATTVSETDIKIPLT